MIRLAAASLAGELIAYRFKHILVRDAAYRATTKKLRATLHERYADWLEQLVGDRVGEYHEILGYHLEAAYRYRTELGLLDGEARCSASGLHAISMQEETERSHAATTGPLRTCDLSR